MTCLLPPRKLPRSQTRRRRPPSIATCTSCFWCADLSCVSDSCSGTQQNVIHSAPAVVRLALVVCQSPKSPPLSRDNGAKHALTFFPPRTYDCTRKFHA